MTETISVSRDAIKTVQQAVEALNKQYKLDLAVLVGIGDNVDEKNKIVEIYNDWGGPKAGPGKANALMASLDVVVKGLSGRFN